MHLLLSKSLLKFRIPHANLGVDSEDLGSAYIFSGDIVIFRNFVVCFIEGAGDLELLVYHLCDWNEKMRVSAGKKKGVGGETASIKILIHKY